MALEKADKLSSMLIGDEIGEPCIVNGGTEYDEAVFSFQALDPFFDEEVLDESSVMQLLVAQGVLKRFIHRVPIGPEAMEYARQFINRPVKGSQILP